jgi:tape measure domain-containing protein
VAELGQPNIIDTAGVLIVPELSDFSRRLRSGVDDAMRQLAASIDRAFSTIERGAADAGADVGRQFQQGGERAEMALREVSTTARREFAEIEASATAASAGIAAKLGGALAVVKTGLLAAGVAAGVGLAAMTGFGLKSAAALEQTTIGLQALTGSAETAKTFLGELQQFAATTPFEFAGVADASRRILAFGTSVGITREQVIPTLTTIGDLVSVLGGTQENVDSVVRALGQMASKGKLSQEEILQLAEALPGFNANAAIASATGMSVADTLALITAGGVPAAAGIQALLKGMAQFPGAAGAMALQSQSLLGVFSTFKDTVSIALTNAFQPAIPAIKSALTELTPILGDAIGQLAPSLGGALSAVLPILGKLIKAIVPILTPILDALGPVLDALEPALQPLGEAIGQVVVALAPVLPVLAQFVGVLAQLAIPILLLLAQVLLPLTPVLNYMAKAIAEVGRALAMINWAEVGGVIAGAFTTAWKAVSEFVVAAAKAVFEFGQMMGTKLREVLDNIATFIASAIIWFKGLPGRILEAVGNLGSTLLNAGADLVRGLWNGILGAGSWLWGKISSFVSDNILAPFKAALGIASPSKVFADQIGTQIPAGIEAGIRTGLPDIAALLSPIVPTGSPGSSGAGGALSFAGGINVTINFVGGTPSLAEASRVGQAAGDGIAQSIARRNIGLAVQMGVAS